MIWTCKTQDHRQQSGVRVALVSAGLMLGTAVVLAVVKAGVMYWGGGSLEGYWDGLLDKIWLPAMMVGAIPSVSGSGSCGGCRLTRLFRRKPGADLDATFPHA